MPSVETYMRPASAIGLSGPRKYLVTSHLFWTSGSLDVPAGVTQEEGNTGFLIHLPSAVHAFIYFLARFGHSFPSSTVKSNFVYYRYRLIVFHLLGFFFFFFFLSGENSQLPGFELTSQRVRRLRGYQLSYRGDRNIPLATLFVRCQK